MMGDLLHRNMVCVGEGNEVVCQTLKNGENKNGTKSAKPANNLATSRAVFA